MSNIARQLYSKYQSMHKTEKHLLISLLVALLTGIFTGCYTPQKAQQQVDKANNKFPEVVAKLARDKYPCIDLLKPDTAVIWKDTVVYVDCPDTASNPFQVVRYDTVNKVVTLPGRTIKVPVTIPAKTVYIDRWFEDSAKLKLAAIERDKLVKENEKQKKTIQDKEKTIRKLTKAVVGLSIPLFLILLYVVYRVWKNFTTFKIQAR